MEGKNMGLKEKIYDRLNDPKLYKKLILGGILLAVLLLFARYVTTAFLIGATVAIAVIVNAMGLRWSGIELATFSTIILGMSFGPKTGAIVGLVLIILQLALGQYINVYVLWVIPGYVGAGIIAGMIGAAAPVATGIGIVFGMNLLFVLFTGLITPPALPRYLPYAGLNVLFNYILFKIFALQIVGVLTG